MVPVQISSTWLHMRDPPSGITTTFSGAGGSSYGGITVLDSPAGGSSGGGIIGGGSGLGDGTTFSGVIVVGSTLYCGVTGTGKQKVWLPPVAPGFNGITS
jgi:hypothetical protein